MSESEREREKVIKSGSVLGFLLGDNRWPVFIAFYCHVLVSELWLVRRRECVTERERKR